MADLSLPNAFPVLHEKQVYNGRNYRAQIRRALAAQQAYLYGVATPVVASFASSQDWTTSGPRLRPSGTADDGPLTLGYFCTPGGCGFKKVKAVVRYKVDGSNVTTDAYAYVDFDLVGGGARVRAIIPRKSEENTVAVDLPAVAEGSVWKVTMRLVNTGASDTDYVYVLAISAYWKPPTASELGVGTLPPTAWREFSMSAWAGGEAENTLALRWLREMLLRQYVYRPRSAFHHWFGATSTTSTSAERLWSGQVYVPALSGTTPTLEFRLGVLNTGASATYEVRINGTSVGSSTRTSSTAIQEFVIAGISASSYAATEVKVEVWASSATAGQTAHLCHVAGWVATLTPEGGTAPTTFAAVPWAGISAGTGIFADADLEANRIGMKALVENTYYLEKYIPHRGLFADTVYRWHQYSGRTGATDKPAPFSLASQSDTTESLPQEVSSRRFYRRIFAGASGGLNSHTSFRYYVGLSLGRHSRYTDGHRGGPVSFQIDHNGYDSNTILEGESQRYADHLNDRERPGIIWCGPLVPHAGASDVTIPQSLRVNIWRSSRGGDYAPFLAGLMVVGAPRSTT